MKNKLSMIVEILLLLSIFLTSCSPVDKNYDVSSEINTNKVNDNYTAEDKIMSSDRMMSKYFDISLFDEENYSEIYLGKKFKINALFNGQELDVPIKLLDMTALGWTLSEGNSYGPNSLVFAYETINLTFKNTNGIVLKAQMYNSSRSSVKLSECYIVKFIIDNNFYLKPDSYNSFNINGITNSMAITDIIYTLGTPSHFYKVSDQLYYFDYFITKKDRRNGITIFINPIEDCITSIEFSFYK